jgi:hypothetical protein
MFTQQWRRAPDLWLDSRILDRVIHQLDLPTRRMINLLNHIARQHMFVIHGLMYIVDRGVRHTRAVENLEPFLRCAEL